MADLLAPSPEVLPSPPFAASVPVRRIVVVFARRNDCWVVSLIVPLFDGEIDLVGELGSLKLSSLLRSDDRIKLLRWRFFLLSGLLARLPSLI
jgi:hypothetical protein